MKNPIFVVIFIIAVFIVGGILYIYNPEPEEYVNPNDKSKEEPIACIADAKLCPDGTYVGRVLPDCEFAPCPTYENKVLPPDAIFEDGTFLE
ncbi:MAG: hypothetical protein JW740_03190 [Candidatus Zambryskibacteria bacterium]|nr:hypothetical protein [Candidatus Zambryskibacteria bacterium]